MCPHPLYHSKDCDSIDATLDRVNKNVLSLFVSLCLVTAWLKGLRVPLHSAGTEYKTELLGNFDQLTKHVLFFSAERLMLNKSPEICRFDIMGIITSCFLHLIISG